MKCIWLTGIPCSGKTTIARELDKLLANSVVLDGDDLRATYLGQDVGFSAKDRFKHILRMGEIAKLFVDNGTYAICAFVSPDRKARDKVRKLFKEGDFIEVFVDADANECARRDVKGMWARALRGEIDNFTGFDGPYDVPKYPEIILNTEELSVVDCVTLLVDEIGYYKEPACMFIGRWNGVFHNGHDYIIQQKLNEGKRVRLAIRDVRPDDSNPWSAKEVKEMIDYRFKDNPNVDSIIIPDVESVEYGRGVGYEVNEIKVDKEIAGISGTKLRQMIDEGDSGWKNFVPEEIVNYFEGD